MRSFPVRSAAALLLLAALLAGCDKLGLGQPHRSKELPTAQQLKRIAYMSQAAGPDGRRTFDRLGQAKSCHDFEIAMRWNRPPDVKGGPFNQKMVYLTAGVPADLPKDSEVFLAGGIEQGQALPSGGSVWAVRLKDGSEVQAVEAPNYAQKQEEAQQNGGSATMIHPYTHGRAFCAYGVYQGATGLSLDQKQHVPLVSVLFAMDRRR
ncbi:MAG TPA: hypothetical protein VJ738_01110 [Steroidobacteraceae bacterium]|nr:hypothetical protein [Steroidobacteraceae bacterium]